GDGDRVQAGGRPGTAERVPRRPADLRPRGQFPRGGAGDRDGTGQLRAHCRRPDHRGGHQRAAGLAADRVPPGCPGRRDTLSDGLQRLAARAWQDHSHLRARGGGRDHGCQRDLRAHGGPMTTRRRITDPVEAMAQRVAERVVDLVLQVVDVNAVLAQVDVNALLEKVDVAALLERVDLNAVLARVDTAALLDRIDVNALMERIDVDALVEQTDLGAVIARSTGGVASEALDAARSQAVGLDQFIDRWVQRALRRKQPAPSAPRALLDGDAAGETPAPSSTDSVAPQPPSPTPHTASGRASGTTQPEAPERRLRDPSGEPPLAPGDAPPPPAPPIGAPSARPGEAPAGEAKQ